MRVTRAAFSGDCRPTGRRFRSSGRGCSIRRKCITTRVDALLRQLVRPARQAGSLPLRFAQEQERMSDKLLKLGIPAGSLQEATGELFRKAGYRVKFPSRSYYPEIDDPEIECLLIRAQEMARYVEQGVLDAGITGYDWILENNAQVHEVCELMFSKVSRRPVRWVLCVPEDSPAKSVSDLQGKRIATEVVELTKSFLAKHGVTAQIEFSW